VAEIVLLHSTLGPRLGMTVAAERLRAAGHVVHVPDLFDGDPPLDSYEQGAAPPALQARNRSSQPQSPDGPGMNVPPSSGGPYQTSSLPHERSTRTASPLTIPPVGPLLVT